MEEVKSVNSEDYDETTVANNNTNTRFSVAVRLSPLGVTVSNSVGSVSNSVGNCCVVLDGSVPNQVEVFSGDGRSAAWIVSHRLDHSCTANRANRANSDSKSSIQTKSSSAATAEEKNGIAMDRGKGSDHCCVDYLYVNSLEHAVTVLTILSV